MIYLQWYTRIFIGLMLITSINNVINSRDSDIGINLIVVLSLIPMLVFSIVA